MRVVAASGLIAVLTVCAPAAAQEIGPQRPGVFVAAALDAFATPEPDVHDAREPTLREGELMALGFDPARFERAELRSRLGVVSSLTASRRFGGLRLEAEASTLQDDVDAADAFAILDDDVAVGRDAATPDIGLSAGEVMGRQVGTVETRAGYINGYYDLDTGRSNLSAQLGLGVGAAEVDLWYAPGGETALAQTDRVAAYQLMAGGRYEVSRRAELLFGARYRGLAGGAGPEAGALRVETGGLIAEVGYKARF